MLPGVGVCTAMQFLQDEEDRRKKLYESIKKKCKRIFWSVKTERAPPDVIFTDFSWLIEVK